MKILLLVAEVWRCDSGGGNTLDNFVSGIDAEFAQIYTSSLFPQNNRCKLYYRFTDSEAVKSFFTKKPFGRKLFLDEIKSENIEKNELPKKTFVDYLKKVKLPLIYLCKEIAWKNSHWKTKELEKFILDFAPDVIYAPCYASPFMLSLTRWVKELTSKNVITWSADDNYSLRQFSLSPSFWIKRLWVRSCIKKTFPYYDVFFSASEDEARYLEPIVGKKIDILRKGTNVNSKYIVRKIHTPIRMIYAGGLYNNRWKTLMAVSSAIRKINKEEVKIVLDIYTSSNLSKKIRAKLSDNRSCFIHKSISQDKLREKYNNSDIAIHCESFDLRQRLATHFSFSTKIIDCLESGCAILAVAWKEQTGFKYLKSQDAAFCVYNIKEMEVVLNNVVNNSHLIEKYAHKAYLCAKENSISLTTRKLETAFRTNIQ